MPISPDGPTRRAALAGLGGLGLLCMAPASLPDPARWRVAADFEPLRAVWLGWDDGHADFSAALVRALRPHVALKMLVQPQAQAEAQAQLQARGISPQAVQWLPSEHARYFVRDAAAFAAGPEGQRAVLAFMDNRHGMPGWCRWRWRGDTRQAAACAQQALPQPNALAQDMAGLGGLPSLESELALEGGALESNGHGLVVVNQALLRQRNPQHSVADIQRLLLALPGVKRVLALPAGLAEDPQMRATIVGKYVGWGTGGHTDQFVRFADERTVLLAWPDADDARRHPVAALSLQRMQANAQRLAQARTLAGQPLRVLKVPMPRLIQRPVVLSADADNHWSDQWTADDFPAREQRRQGDTVWQVAPASYLNFIVANGVVVLPDYVPHGTPPQRQAQVQRLMEQAFAGRELAFVDTMNANWHGGGPHCASLNEA